MSGVMTISHSNCNCIQFFCVHLFARFCRAKCLTVWIGLNEYALCHKLLGHQLPIQQFCKNSKSRLQIFQPRNFIFFHQVPTHFGIFLIFHPIFPYPALIILWKFVGFNCPFFPLEKLNRCINFGNYGQVTSFWTSFSYEWRKKNWLNLLSPRRKIKNQGKY